MASKLESVCKNPPVPTPDQTVGRCALCNKPLSEDVVFRQGGDAFCGKEAAAQYAESNRRMEALEKKGGGFIGVLIKLIVIAGIAAAAWFAYQHFANDPDAAKNLQQKLNDVSNKAEDAIKK